MKRTWADKPILFPEFDNSDEVFTREDMDEDREEEWVAFCFDAYEADGFKETFGTPYYENREYDGMKFTVLGRVPNIEDDFENGADLECLPMWRIKLENGLEMDAYPDEICLSETDEYRKSILKAERRRVYEQGRYNSACT